jgi:uncharacterized protein
MTTAPAQPAPARQGLLARRPLVSFFVMAYAFSWLVWSPWVLGQDGAGLLPFKFSHAASGHLLTAGIIAGPTLSAFIMTATTEGRAGVRRLLEGVMNFGSETVAFWHGYSKTIPK